MWPYILRRLTLGILSVLGVSILVFLLVRLIPGDAVIVYLGEGRHTEQEIQQTRALLGLDSPIFIQYARWLAGVAHGNLGQSFTTGRPIGRQILDRLPVTAELAVLSFSGAFFIAMIGGILSAIRQDSIIDHLVRLFSIGGLSVPIFWTGTMLIVFPALWFKWLPPQGYVSPFQDLATNLKQYIFPVAVMGISLSAGLMRMTRATLLEVLRQDYIRTAWSKGLSERLVILRHALKNAMIPVVTLMGVQLGSLLGGTVIVEQIFSLPGLGRLTLEAISFRDLPQVQGNVLFFATVFLVMNLVVDVLYAWLDPRIRYA